MSRRRGGTYARTSRITRQRCACSRRSWLSTLYVSPPRDPTPQTPDSRSRTPDPRRDANTRDPRPWTEYTSLCTRGPQHATLKHTPYTIHPETYTLHAAPCTPHLEPYTLHHKPCTRDPWPFREREKEINRIFSDTAPGTPQTTLTPNRKPPPLAPGPAGQQFQREFIDHTTSMTAYSDPPRGVGDN